MNETRLEEKDFTRLQLAMKFARNDVEELSALLSYKSTEIVRLNKIRALSRIDCAIEELQELKTAVEKL